MLQWLKNILQLIIVTYLAVKGVFSEATTSFILIMFIEMIQTYAVLFCPAIVTEMVINEYVQIKKILTSQLHITSDESLRFELQTALQYLNLRPFRYTLCRAVPLDINLLLTTASICITYIIVLLQLTHLSM
uniref:Gustatory receptor n=1 Tax=Heliothis virescens TaxID=7102 RepID=A0A2A4JJM3_HELVI